MDKVKKFSSDRVFLLWDTLVTSQQLMLRSHQDRDNIDLIFNGVFYVDVPFKLLGLKLAKPTAAEHRRLAKRSQHIPRFDQHFYALVSKDQRYFVGASNLVIEHNSQSMVDPFFFTAKYLYESQQEDFYRCNVDQSVEYLPS